MTFKRPLSVSPPPPYSLSTSASSTTKVKKEEVEPQTEQATSSNICLVCGDVAHIHNYGALSCMSCKSFFRRNGFNWKNAHPCRSDGKCETSILTRRLCTACRFSKCLRVGMSPNLIRKEDLSEKQPRSSKNSSHKQIAMPQQVTTVAQPCTLNLLRADRSLLSASDWRLISNVVDAFDTFSPVLETRSVIEDVAVSSDVSQSLRLFSTFYTSAQSFIRSTPEFQVLTLKEKCSLFERNLHGVLRLFATYMLHEAGAIDNAANENVILSMYNFDIVRQRTRVAVRLDYDPTFIKLMIGVLTFSSNCYIVDRNRIMNADGLLMGTFRLLGSQNVYVEVLWKYMINRYGYMDAALRFAKLIKEMLDLLKLSGETYKSNEAHHSFIEDITEQTTHELTIAKNEPVPLRVDE